MAALKGLHDQKKAVQAVLSDCQFGGKTARAGYRTLSGGQRQRVGIAQALLGEPRFLIFDEPTVGLDPEERIHFRNLFSRAAQDKLVLLSTHIIEDVQSVCNRLIVIHHGRIRFSGTPQELIRMTRGTCVHLFRTAGGRTRRCISPRASIPPDGVQCRAVARTLPAYAQPAEPTLEDAYLYLIEEAET